jgi:uncharacterized protein YjbI with pentapeptide repeats
LTIALLLSLGLSVAALIYVHPGTAKERSDLLDVVTKIVGGPLLLASLILTWGNLAQTQEVASKTLANARETLEATRNAQAADRFLRAVEQLDPQASLEQRLGAIFSLERIARASADDYWPTIELLSGYLRSNAAFNFGPGGRSRVPEPKSSKRSEDIQAAIRVLGRRVSPTGQADPARLFLQSVDLSNLHLERLNLSRAYFWHCCFDYAPMGGADLRNTAMEFALLRWTNLKGADLRYANLSRVNLSGANLESARLEGAHLDGALGVTPEALHDAFIDELTVPPDDFPKRAWDALLRRSDERRPEAPGVPRVWTLPPDWDGT